MKTPGLLVALILSLAAMPLHAAPVLTDFAHQAQIETSAAGPFQRLSLPLAVYQGRARADLGDLRVFNGRGEILPYALWRSEGTASSQSVEIQAPFFPLAAAAQPGAATGEVSLTVRRAADGSLVAIHLAEPARHVPASVPGVVIDASQLPGARSLSLTAAPGRQGFHAFSLESSDDLQHWQNLQANGMLVDLEHAGHQLDKHAVSWERPAGRYLRLLWRDASLAPTLRAVTLGRSERVEKPLEYLWSALLTPSAAKESRYDYVVAGQLPLERLRIELPQANLLLPYTLQREVCGMEFHRHHGRPHEECYWQHLAQGVAYRLESPEGETRAADLELPGMPVSRLRLLFDQRGGSLAGASPAIRVGFVAQDLVFLARGEPPFTLAWGAATVPAADLPLATLIPAYRTGAALPAGSARLLPEVATARSASASAVSAGKRGETAGETSAWLLWSVLLAGLLVMAMLARSLVVQMGKAKDKAKEQGKDQTG